jgi:hypothetical protein
MATVYTKETIDGVDYLVCTETTEVVVKYSLAEIQARKTEYTDLETEANTQGVS